jgi:hypothetical protein
MPLIPVDTRTEQTKLIVETVKLERGDLTLAYLEALHCLLPNCAKTDLESTSPPSERNSPLIVTIRIIPLGNPTRLIYYVVGPFEREILNSSDDDEGRHSKSSLDCSAGRHRHCTVSLLAHAETIRCRARVGGCSGYRLLPGSQTTIRENRQTEPQRSDLLHPRRRNRPCSARIHNHYTRQRTCG